VGGDYELPKPMSSPGSPGFQREQENPSLAEEVDAALSVLGKNPNGFFLMAEQGTIDHANHVNDYAGMVGGVHDLDNAVRAVEAYIDMPGDDLAWDTTDLVTLAARRAGADLFTNRQDAQYPGTRIIDNTDIYTVLMKAAGLQ
jgi:alkaline phosphatase